jgi:hypothetical protein
MAMRPGLHGHWPPARPGKKSIPFGHSGSGFFVFCFCFLIPLMPGDGARFWAAPGYAAKMLMAKNTDL